MFVRRTTLSSLKTHLISRSPTVAMVPCFFGSNCVFAVGDNRYVAAPKRRLLSPLGLLWYSSRIGPWTNTL